MTRIYRYILTHDTGMAPCPENAFISLATCKPVIRRLAKSGDWVLGFRPGPLVRGLVLWAGKVERSMTHGEYQRTHPKRSDAVYRLTANGHYERLTQDYHPSQSEMNRDTGAPVLLFARQQSHYFNGIPRPLPEVLAHLAAAGRGHRVTEATPDLVARLEAWLGGLEREEPGSPVDNKANCGRAFGRRRLRSGC
jgi:hypothetical protein